MEANEFAGRASRTKGREATGGVIPGRFALSVGMPDLPEPPGWRWTPLSGVAQLESGHTPSRKHPEYWDDGIPWIGIKDAVDNHGRVITDTYQHVSQLGLENSSARLLPARTVCLSRTASVGFVVVMGRSMATSQDFVNWVCGPSLEPDYLKYILLAERDTLFRFASGTTHQTIYYPEAKAFHALLPRVEEQRRILGVLGTLDDKIEVNRRMNETLEAMARALFKSWFVDFDPVRAKAAGRPPPGMDADTAKLFPSEFEDSALGEIPKGWRIARLGDVMDLKRGYDLPGPRRRPGHVPIVSSSGTSGFHDEAKARAPGVVTGRYGTIGQVFYVRVDFWPLNTTLYVRDFKGTDRLYAFHLLRLIDFEKFSDKGAVPGINRNHMHEEQIVAPPMEPQQRFAAMAERWLDLAARRIEQTVTLIELRDALLPRLLSGELSVSKAEGTVEAIA